MVLNQQESFTKYLSLDVDETIFNSVYKHWQWLTAEGKRRGWKKLPSYKDVLHAGGTHKAYGHFDGYWELNEEMRNSPDFNRNLQEIPGAKKAIRFLQAMVGLYLTTRPESLAYITKEELDRKGFPDRQVIARPEHVPLENTSEWKLAILQQLSQEWQAKMIMIDDSMSMHNAIHALGEPLVATILFAGPMTPKGNGELSWDKIPNVVKKM